MMSTYFYLRDLCVKYYFLLLTQEEHLSFLRLSNGCRLGWEEFGLAINCWIAPYGLV